MLSRLFVIAFGVAFTFLAPFAASAQSQRPLTLPQALQRALAANPRLTVAERDVGIATGQRIQAGALPNPELSYEIDNAYGTGPYRGTRSAESTLQLSQLVEFGPKREARISAATAEVDVARWQREAERLEVISETAIAFINVLSDQRRVQILDAQIISLELLVPLLQRRVDAGASSPAEIARAKVAADLVRVERERVKTALAMSRRELAALMGVTNPDFGPVVGNLSQTGTPPAYPAVIRSLEGHPQLIRWTAVRAQRKAELLAARLRPVPDVRVGVGWRHFRDTGDNAVRLGLSMDLPVFDRNQGTIISAQETLARTEAERLINKTLLTVLLGRAYDTIMGSLQELTLLRNSVMPNARSAVEGIESGYSQGRFTLLEVLDAQGVFAQAALREQDALVTFHTAVATLESLTGTPLSLARERQR